MELGEFVSGISAAIDLADASIKPDTALRQLAGWDSLCMLNVIAYVDEISGIVLTARQIKLETTVADLWRIVTAHA